jgi:hypothetical protein
MNTKRNFCFRLLQAGGCAAALIGLPVAAHAQASDLIVDTFDTADDVLGWSRWWGSAPQTYEFDPTMDANGNANSGSLKATVDFDVAAYTGDNQFALQGDLPGQAVIDGTLYKTLSFDLKWDTTSPQRPSGDYGYFEYGFRTTDYSSIPPGPGAAFNVPGTNGWIHVDAPIDKTTAKLDTVNGIFFKMWSGDPASGQTGTATFWIDNVKLIADTNVQTAPPTLSLQKAQPGLNLIASASGQQYQRQSIRTVDPSYSWVGASEPVTYSVTVTNYPGTNNSGFQTQIFLVPGDSISAGESSPDYNEPNVVFLDIQNNNTGGAYATFRYKTNEPGGNSQIYGSGAIASIGTAQPNGTWSLTFSNDTSVTLTGPGGVSTNFDLPADVPASFAGPLYAYFGIQPNNTNNIGQSAVFSNVTISGGVPTPINENFEGVTDDPANPVNLDPAIWERSAQDTSGVVLVPPDSTYWVNWTVPASGYTLQISPDLTPNSWVDYTGTATQIGSQIRAIVGASTLPTGPNAFFRLVKQPPTEPGTEP